jgi:hypothetical protein
MHHPTIASPRQLLPSLSPHGASAWAIVPALTSLSSTSAFLSPLFYNIQNNARKLFYSTKIVTDTSTDEIWNFLQKNSNFFELQRIPQRLADVDESDRATTASRYPLSSRSRPALAPPLARSRPASASPPSRLLSPPSRPLPPRQRGRQPGGIARSRRATEPAPAAALSPPSRLPLASLRAIPPRL